MESTLLDLWGKEKLPPETLVWTEGMSEWVEIQYVKALSDTFTARVSSRPAGMNDWVEGKHVKALRNTFTGRVLNGSRIFIMLTVLLLLGAEYFTHRVTYYIGYFSWAFIWGAILALPVSCFLSFCTKRPFWMTYLRVFLPSYSIFAWFTVRNTIIVGALFRQIPVNMQQAIDAATFSAIVTALPTVAVWYSRSMPIRIGIIILAMFIPCLFLGD